MLIMGDSGVWASVRFHSRLVAWAAMCRAEACGQRQVLQEPRGQANSLSQLDVCVTGRPLHALDQVISAHCLDSIKT